MSLRLVAEVHNATLEKFSCGDPGLDSFLNVEAKDYAEHAITNTIVAFADGFEPPVAFISLAAHTIRLSSFELGELGLPFQCNFSSFPAVRITKLATHEDWQSKGVGARIIELVEGLAFQGYAAARLLTVDAVNRDRTVKFYEKVGFFKSSYADRPKAQKPHPAQKRSGRQPPPPSTILMLRDVHAAPPRMERDVGADTATL